MEATEDTITAVLAAAVAREVPTEQQPAGGEIPHLAGQQQPDAPPLNQLEATLTRMFTAPAATLEGDPR